MKKLRDLVKNKKLMKEVEFFTIFGRVNPDVYMSNITDKNRNQLAIHFKPDPNPKMFLYAARAMGSEEQKVFNAMKAAGFFLFLSLGQVTLIIYYSSRSQKKIQEALQWKEIVL
jgi:hypothetical protein